MSRIVLITGASRGLGRSMAEHLARAGWGVIGTYSSNRQAADEVAAGIAAAGGTARMLRFDAAEPGSIGTLVDEVQQALRDGFGAERLDALVNNAGIGELALFADTTEEQFDRVLLTNLKAPFFLTQRLLPVLADGGRVLNVSSGLARFTGPGYSAYAATKGAVEVLTRYQAQELAARGIRVNVVAPGAIATDFGGGAVRDVPQVAEAVAHQVALGRAGEADEIGSAVAAILSDDFRWVDGARIEVSGGQNL
ncbi:SDR family NAD(P)-dependent oxidoreductase [Amnibacterium setariae]|uniref:SDR family oxidoreductase n=1 Tax=Amnibacterium setariae TaxID=2306585 RepID=A0A3A1TXN9_9MICO|nr:SDR family oxidoreductase [Amnibacterium setariae]RIX28540.1 SDR family oxidoreductase [Amnibacterium setariae]